MTSTAQNTVLSYIEKTRPYAAPVSDEIIRTATLRFLLSDLIPNAIGRYTHLALGVFDHPANDPAVYREDVEDALKEFSVLVNANLSEKHTAYIKQRKVMSQAFSRVYALQASKTPNEKAIDAAFEVANGEQSKLNGTFLADLLDAQRVESYFRGVITAYHSQSTEDATWCLLTFLRVGQWSPRTNDRAKVESFYSDLLGR